MRKIDRLKKEALEACNFRGHKVSRFVNHSPKPIQIAHSYCIICRKSVIVNNSPLPNEIEISGRAVALTCNDF